MTTGTTPDADAPESRPDTTPVLEPDELGSPLGRAMRLAALVGLIVLLGVTQGVPMVIVVISIVVMIFLHELGHFVMARRAGMLATEFFIGFGPRIWSFRRGETEYGVKAIPAGAYVKIIGMSNMEDVDPELEGRTYRQKSFLQRLGVAVAGSAMHFLIALVLLLGYSVLVGVPDGERWKIDDITDGSAADVAGLRSGDEILRFGDREVGSWDDFRTLIAQADPGRVELQILRDGEERALPIDLSVRAKLIGTIGQDIDVIDNGERILVGDAPEGGAAAAAGVVAGSTLAEVNGEPLRSLDDLASAAESSTGGRVRLTTVGVDGGRSEHRVDLGSDVGATEPRAFVGVGSAPVLVRESLPDAAVGSVETFWEVTRVSIQGIGRFLWPPNMIGFVVDAFSGAPGDATDTPTLAEETPSTVSETRPISIVGVAMLGSDISSQGLSQLVPFLATLNIFIGVFNLFPLLPFDGGHVVVAVYEKLQELRRRSRERYLADVSRMIPVAYGVVIVLGVIGLLAIFVDLTRGVSL